MDNELFNKIFNEHRNVFLTGVAGSGKTFLIQSIYKEAIGKGINIALTALTGCAALTMGESAVTIHKFSGIGIGDKTPNETCRNIYSRNKYAKNNWEKTQILVIDEVSFMGKKTLELLSYVAKNINNTRKRFNGNDNNPFGKIQVIFSGDMLQLQPINDEYCFKSPIWNEFNFYNHKLTTSKRFTDINYYNLLKRIRVGKQTDEDINILSSRVTNMFELTFEERQNKFKEIFLELLNINTSVWKDLLDIVFSYTDYTFEIVPTKLYSLRRDVANENEENLKKIKESKYNSNAKDIFPVHSNKKQIEKYTKHLDSNIPKIFSYKIGSQVMLTYNLDIENGLINGSRGMIMSKNNKELFVKFVNGQTINISPMNFDFEIRDEDHVNKFTRVQYPLCLAYCMSIHKSQSATLDYVLADLGSSIFAPHMGYVVLSRIRNIESLFLSSFDPKKLYVDQEALEFDETL